MSFSTSAPWLFFPTFLCIFIFVWHLSACCRGRPTGHVTQPGVVTCCCCCCCLLLVKPSSRSQLKSLQTNTPVRVLDGISWYIQGGLEVSLHFTASSSINLLACDISFSPLPPFAGLLHAERRTRASSTCLLFLSSNNL